LLLAVGYGGVAAKTTYGAKAKNNRRLLWPTRGAQILLLSFVGFILLF
jgi:hypothetical protein